MLEELKEKVLKANLMLPKYNLVDFTWGNVSELDQKTQFFVIKPSGVPYEELTIEKMVVVDLNAQVIEGKLNPSSDTPTHAVLYKNWSSLQAITHTHSNYASTWAQAGIDIQATGTTHADCFYGTIPCTKPVDFDNIEKNYEHETGLVICRCFEQNSLNWESMPAVLVNNHGPFTFGKDAISSVKNAKILEIVAQMAWQVYTINKFENKVPKKLLDTHYFRKHGKNAYYGQNNKK